MSDERDTTDQNDETQQEISADPAPEILGDEPNQPTQQLSLVKPKHQYDPAAIAAFVSSVFHTVPDGAEILRYAPPIDKTPAKPSPNFDSNISKDTARALYYSIASSYPDEKGNLGHKLSNFAALHVVVLDDIGTKIPVDAIPKELLPPTYIIESSEGNFQYGYVLDTPETDLEKVKALLELLKRRDPAITDTGGISATKLVRLPDGVNGKGDPAKRMFHVKLIDNTGPVYTFDRMTKAISNGQVHESDLKDSLSLKTPNAPAIVDHGDWFTSRDMEIEHYDEILDFCKRRDMLVHYASITDSDWHEIECPWAHEHSDGSDTAGYSPIGRGDTASQKNRRQFHCFHQHCNHRTIHDLIEYVLANDESYESIASRMPVGHLIDQSNYALSWTKSNTAYQIAPYKETHLNVMYRKYWAEYTTHSIKWGENGAKLVGAKTKPVDYWATRGPTKKIFDEVYEVGAPALPAVGRGDTNINLYRAPPWADGNFDQAPVDRFVNYLEYLIPDDGEREYLIDWLSAKMQNPKFRGTAILMVTDGVQGVGRSTLGKIVTDLVGFHNAASIQFNALVDKDGFNEWLKSLVVVVDEIKSGDMNRFEQNEKLKTHIDTSPQYTTLNVKHGFKGQIETCSSFLMFSNHLDAIALTDEDRRITVLRNPDVKDDALTADINQWRLNDPSYAQDIYRWLRQRPVDTARLHYPYASAAKKQMIADNKSPMTRVIDAIKFAMEQKGHIAIEPRVLKEVSEQLAGALDVKDWHKAYRRASLESFTPNLRKFTIRQGRDIHKIRLIKGCIPGAVELKASDFHQTDENRIRDDIADMDVTEITTIARDELSD